MRPATWTRKSAVLVSTFAALLLVMGAAATAVWWSARKVQGELTDLHAEHTRANAALASIRAGVYLTGILTRDYLLSEDGSGASSQYLRSFEAIREDTERNFGILEQMRFGEEQRAALAKLKREISTQYWERTAAALAWTPQQKRLNRGNLVGTLARRRREVSSLAMRLEDLIAANFFSERQRAAAAARQFQTSAVWTIVAATLLGFAISGVAWARMSAMERRSREAESELRRLSGQIRTAQEEERKNLSRELHDEVGQLLTGLRMELSGIARLAEQQEVKLRLEAAKATVERLIGSIRNIAQLLRPSMLDDLGLAAALAWLVKELSRNSAMEIRSRVDPAADALPEAHRTCLYRVVQEALTNVVRHSGARRADVTVQMAAGLVTTTVTDDGRGFDLAVASGHGLGMIGIEERVKELGGEIRVVSSPGRGTRLEVRLPLRAEPEVMSDQSFDRGRPRDRAGGLEASA